MNAQQLREKLKSIVRPAPTAVTVPTLGEVHVRQFTGAELDYLVASKSDGGQLGRTELVGRALCDEHGEPAFDMDEPGNRELVGNLPTGDMQTIFEVVRRINGLAGSDSPTNGG